jgi:MOSC domain-containing protein YiiM
VANSPGDRGAVVSINLSFSKGVRKEPAGSGTLLEETGLEGDAHAGFGHRQVSLLAIESIDKMKDLGLDVGPGDFAENVTTSGVDLASLPIGTRLRLGEALLEVSQIGKVCHSRCAIFEQAGDCVMPREGIFARVLAGGNVRTGDPVEVLRKEPEHG